MSEQDLVDGQETLEKIGTLLDGLGRAGFGELHAGLAGYVRERRGKLKGGRLPFRVARDLMNLQTDLEKLVPIISDPFAFQHLVEIRDDDYAIQHPLTERSDHDGQMFDCPLHRWLGSQEGPPVALGRYVAVEQDDPAAPFELKPIGHPCRVCGYAGTCGEPAGEDCHS